MKMNFKNLTYPSLWVITIFAHKILTSTTDFASSTGLHLALYLSIKCMVAVLCFTLAYGVGAAILARLNTRGIESIRDNETETLVLSLITGLSAISLLNFIIASLSAYTFLAYITLVIATSYLTSQYIPTPSSCVNKMRTLIRLNIYPLALSQIITSIFAIFTLVGLALYIFVAKSIYPDFGGDIFYYIRYFKLILSSHSIFPPAYDHLVYFPTKFSGIHYIVNILYDTSYISACTATYYITLILCLFNFTRSITKDVSYSILPSILFSSNFFFILFTNNFTKANFPTTVFTTVAAYLIWKLYNSQNINKIKFTLYILLATLGLGTLVVVLFAGLICTIPTILYSINRRSVVQPVFGLIIMSFSYVTVSAINYLALGVADLSLADKQLKIALIPENTYYINDLSCWFLTKLRDEYSLASSIQEYFGNVSQLSITYTFRQNTFLPWTWAISIFGLLYSLRFDNLRRAALTGWAIFLIIAAEISLRSLLHSWYIRTHSTFLFDAALSATFFTLGIYLAIASIKQSKPLNTHKLLNSTLHTSMFALIASYSIYSFPHNLKDDARERFEFLLMHKTPISIVSNYYPELKICDSALTDIPEPQGILPLSQLSPCTGYTMDKITDPVTTKFSKDTNRLLTSDESDTLKILHDYNTDFLIVDTQGQPTLYLYLEAFSPENILNHYKVNKRINYTTYLLERKHNTPTGNQDKDFEPEYSKFYANNTRHHSYNHFVAAREIALSGGCQAKRR